MTKIAVAGKGGVGKTTLAALLARIYAEQGKDVLAVDADPAACLASALGLPADLQARVVPIVEMTELIEERTEHQVGTYGAFFKLNPRVDDIPERFSVLHRGVRLLRMGTVEKGGGGCICPESTMLKALVTHLILYDKDVLILDMDAGLEHLGRATAHGVDHFLIVVEPGRRSIDTAHQIARLAADIGIQKVWVVGNKIRGDADRAYIQNLCPDLPILGYLSYTDDAIQADQDGSSVYDSVPLLADEARHIEHVLSGK